ncbi:hypothetical protein BKA01_002274 [Pseudonocardia eucalypti]|nr:hypothetical protein [Pseudonocardia eucalypti]
MTMTRAPARWGSGSKDGLDRGSVAALPRFSLPAAGLTAERDR